MAGAMRRMGIYLGLVEEDDARAYGRYDARQGEHPDYERRYARYSGEDPAPAFARLAALSERLRADHPGAVEISAGMTGDLEQAIVAGATLVRVGTAIFGERDLPSGSDSHEQLESHQPPGPHGHPGDAEQARR